MTLGQDLLEKMPERKAHFKCLQTTSLKEENWRQRTSVLVRRRGGIAGKGER